MAFQQQFSDRLLQQMSDVNNRNLHLESLLAQKDDQIAHLQRTLANSHGGSSHGVTGNGVLPHGYDMQLNKANERATNAEETLKNSIRSFDKEYKSWQKQIKALKSELDAARGPNASRPASAPPTPFESGAKVVALQSELKKAKSELQKLKTAYQGLQRQFQAEKKEHSRLQKLPATDPAKAAQFQDDDQDDEEPDAPWIKQEPRRPSSNASVSMLPPPQPSQLLQPSQALEPIQTLQQKPSRASTPLRRLSRASDTSVRRSSGDSNIDVSLAHRLKPSQLPKPTIESFLDSTIQQKGNKRRRRQSSSSITKDLDDSYEDSDRDDAPLPPRKRTRGSRGSISKENSKPSEDHSELKRRFSFQAITGWPNEGEPSGFHSEDLHDCMDELWERIQWVKNLWEARCDDWTVEFDYRIKQPNSNKSPVCVSSKMKIEGREHANTKWRPDCEGKYACRKCVEANLPCFTWNGSEFRLLPLHKDDRRYEDKEGVEIRTWLNVF